MAEGLSSDQLPVKMGQEYRVKLGKSFTFPKENAYHTIKYDFKPLSVDLTKPGKLRVADDEVNVLLPLGLAESTDDVAQFRGPKKPSMKECVLIIDTVSGEAVLEKISNTIPLKAIRDGRKLTGPRDRSVSPSPYPPHMTQSKPPPTIKATQPTPSTTHTPPTSTGSTTKKRPIKTKGQKVTSVKQEGVTNGNIDRKKGSKKTTKKVSAVKNEPPTIAPTVSNMPPAGTLPSANAGPSMPVFSMATTQRVETTIAARNEASNVTSYSMPDPNDVLPNSAKRIKLESKSSTTSSSSDSSDSEPDISASHASHVISHMPQVQPTTHNAPYGNSQFPPSFGGHTSQPVLPIGHLPRQLPQQHSSSSSSSGSSDSSSGSSSSDSSSDSSDQENDREVASAFTQQQNNLRPRTMSQLRTDLQLSDSGSDSDS